MDSDPSSDTSPVDVDPDSSVSAAAATATAATPPKPRLKEHRGSVWATLLQRSYNPPFLSPSASIIHAQGSLKKFGSKLTTSSLNARHFILSHHSLQYYKSNPLISPQGSITLNGSIITLESDDIAIGLKPIPSPGCIFSITTLGTTTIPSRKYMLVTNTASEARCWREILLPSTNDTLRASLTTSRLSDWERDSNLCLEGWLIKSNSDVKATNWTRRYFIFHRSTNTLVYLKSPPTAAGFVPIESSALVDVVGKSISTSSSSELANYSATTLSKLPPGIDTLSILAYTQSQDRCYVLLAASKQERDEWVAALKCAIEYRNGAIQSFDKSQSKQRVISSSLKASNALALAVAASLSSSSPISPSSSSSSSSASASSAAPAASRSPPPPPVPTSPRGAAMTNSTPKSITDLPSPALSSSPEEATSASVLADDDEDAWAMGVTGRKAGQSVSYVNLAAATASAATPKKSNLLQVNEDDADEEEEEEDEENDGEDGDGDDDDESVVVPSTPSNRSAHATISSNVSSSSTDHQSRTVSHASMSTPTPTPRSSNLKLVEKTILELYSTESTFVNILRTICSTYLLRFKKYLDLKFEPKWFEMEEWLNLTIFQHIETIRDINTRLLKELEAIQKDGNVSSSSSISTTVTEGSKILSSLGRIGSTFRQFIPFFKVYTLFAQSYDEQLKTLDTIVERRSSLKTFLTLTDTCEGTTFASLMITPVQRVGRYVLLLETILRNTPEGYEGTKDIELALHEMRRVGTLINETVALWEAKSKVVELQSKLDVPILAPGRYLVRDGVLRKVYDRTTSTTGFFAQHLGKKVDSFVFFLCNDVLLQCKKSQLGEKYSHRVTMPLDGMVLESLPDSSDQKSSWTITYSTTGLPSMTVSTTGPMRSLEIETLQTSPLATLRPPSISQATIPNVPTTPTHNATPAAPNTPGGGSGSNDDRKTITVYAASNEEKQRWMNDIKALINEMKQKNKTLMRG